ncbi:MAG: S8 family serine peptidase [Methanophagales archaeon]|nr:S8 family serine peptidase [Methanophagales archaeon]
MRKIVAILMAMLMVMSVTVALAGGVAAKGTEPKVPVIIGFKDTPGQADKDMIRGLGGDIKYEYHLIPAIAVSMSPQACDAMMKNKNVAYIEPDGEVHALQTIPWGIDRVFGDEKYSFSTWDSSRGSDVAVAVLDTGIDEYHEDLTVLNGTNTIDGTHWGADGHGHGTHVAGTVAALDNTVGVVGVAPDVGLYAVKVLADSGSGTVSSVVAGIEWSVDNNMQIISMSLGTSTDYQTLRDAVDAAYGEGLLLVAAAGNDGNPAGRGDNVGYPAKYESVIAVAATDQNDNRASWSSTGPAVELAAPGVSINSTLPGDKYGTKSGTSMACPHVTGVAALVWAVNPGLNNTDVRGILQQTAEDLGLPATHQGYGLVRADAAVAMAEGTEPPATGSINGTVTDTDETAIEGATVVVEGTTLSATTGAEGYYLLENVPVGDQEVTASANGYYSNTTTVTVIKDDTVTQDFTLEAIPTYTVSGTVTDTKDTALEGAIVTIAGTELSATTEGDGSYSISEVKDGTYDITASKEGYSSQTNKTVTVNEDTVVNFALEEITVTTLNVKVTTDKEQYSRNSWVYITVTVTDTEDQAVGGASVGLTVYYPDESVAATGSGTTNSNGIVELRYRVMPKAPTGDYKVVATADLEGYETGTGETMFKVV